MKRVLALTGLVVVLCGTAASIDITKAAASNVPPEGGACTIWTVIATGRVCP